jgi:hypothetical protein
MLEGAVKITKTRIHKEKPSDLSICLPADDPQNTIMTKRDKLNTKNRTKSSLLEPIAFPDKSTS